MKEQIKLIASRIKELREIAGSSLSDLSGELDIDPRQMASYESGETDIPVSVLLKLSHRYKLELTDLLSGEQPKLHVYSVVRKGKGIRVDRRRQYAYENLAYNFIHKKVEPFIVTVVPDKGNQPPEFNSHPGQEFNFVLDGSLMVIVDGHEIVLNEGDSIYFDSGYQHAMKALNDLPSRFLAVII